MELEPLQAAREEPDCEENKNVIWKPGRIRLVSIILLAVVILVGYCQVHSATSNTPDEEPEEKYRMLCIPKNIPAESCIRPVPDATKARILETCGLGTEPEINEMDSLQIQNGYLMGWHESPWAAALVMEQANPKYVSCTAVVLSDIHLALTAHCFWDNNLDRMITNLNLFRIYYGGVCALYIDGLCRTDMPDENKYEISRVYYPRNFLTSVDNYDFAIIQVDRPMPIIGRYRPICYKPWDVKEPKSKQAFIRRFCKKGEKYVSAGFSGVSRAKPHFKTGRLRKFSCEYGDTTPRGSDYITLKSVPKGSDIPSIVKGDSGGPVTCRMADGKKLLIGVIEQDDDKKREGFFDVAFLPQHGRQVICKCTNLCEGQ